MVQQHLSYDVQAEASAESFYADDALEPAAQGLADEARNNRGDTQVRHSRCKQLIRSSRRFAFVSAIAYAAKAGIWLSSASFSCPSSSGVSAFWVRTPSRNCG